MRVVVCWLALLVTVSPCLADVYKCPSEAGGTRYQTTPCPGTAAPFMESAPRPIGAPLPHFLPTLPPVSAPPPPPPTATPALPTPPSSQPVSTTQFGFIALGMGEQEVRRRLGPPAEVLDAPTLYRHIVGGDVVEVRRTVWVYPGTRQIMRAVIAFENGVVVDKKKTQEW